MGGGSAVVVNLDRVKKCTLKKLKKLGNNQSNPIKYIAWVPMSHPVGTIVACDKNLGYICRGYLCLGYRCRQIGLKAQRWVSITNKQTMIF